MTNNYKGTLPPVTVVRIPNTNQTQPIFAPYKSKTVTIDVAAFYAPYVPLTMSGTILRDYYDHRTFV